jgi:RND family efflux transporter MFP subunit
VRKGQVLARLEDNAYRASLDAALAAARASHAQVGQLEAQLRQAQADARRQDTLVAQGLTSKQAAEQARTAVASYAAQVSAQQREAEAADAQARQAQVNFDYTVVRSPFDGVITEKAAQVGEIVSPLSAGGGFTRTGIGTIVDMDSLEIQVDVNESYINRVAAGQPVEATLNAYPDWKVPGAVIAIIPTADRTKATVKVRIAIKSKDPRIVPDMGVRVGFLESKPAGGADAPAVTGVLVPPEAVRAEGNGSVVFVYADGRAERRAVTLGPDVGGQRRVVSGLRDGERVVLSPATTLRDGQTVKTAEGR